MSIKIDQLGKLGSSSMMVTQRQVAFPCRDIAVLVLLQW